MADDRSTPQGVISQAIGHISSAQSPPPPTSPASNTSSTSTSSVKNSPPRGPRTLLLKRCENGFGFTLRHFIVYPPESCYTLPGHERTRIDEPMDTIFVKQVRPNSSASEAGLRTGDRVVSVDGVPTRGEQYSSVVQRIQQAGAWLRLLVVSKEDDILQRYFGETAHNPETNQRPARLRSPERILQKQRRSMSMIPGPSSRSRQSWMCSTLPGTENKTTTTKGATSQYYNSHEESIKDQTATKMTSAPNIQRRPLVESRNKDSIYNNSNERIQQRRSLPQDVDTKLSTTPSSTSSTTTTTTTTTNTVYRPSDNNTRFDLYDRTRPESIYSRPSSEQIYDRIKDPIYELVHPELNTEFSKSLDHQYPMSHAEPQVPIYRSNKRVVTRRASEGCSSSGEQLNDNNNNNSNNKTIKIQTTIDPTSRLSIESHRDTSPASKDSSISSFDSTSTLTGNECSDDSVIMTRLRKSFEQKEEFLRRPSHPIGWLLPDDNNSSKNPLLPLNNSGIIQREFYARPQKLQRQVWPPIEQQQQQQQQKSDILLSNNYDERIKNSCKTKQQNKHNDIDNNHHDIYNDNTNDDLNNIVEDAQAIRDRFYSSLYDTNGQFNKNNHFSYSKNNDLRTTTNNNHHNHTNNTNHHNNNINNSNNNNNSKQFITTLSRIHENVQGQGQVQQQSIQENKNGTSSLPSSPVPDKKLDKLTATASPPAPTPPQGLQIVSKRAKQFETGRLLSDDDEPTSDRTNLYKSELSRLSNKRSVPNVAVRKREFESKAESKDIRRIIATRESKSLDSSEPLVTDMEPVRLRARSNSVESWNAINGDTSRRGVRNTWQNEPDDEDDDDDDDNDDDDDDDDDNEIRNSKAKRQDSYLEAVRTQKNAPGSNTTATNGVVLRRQKNNQISDEDRATRRVSYLKATWGERMHVDSDLELSDSEPVNQSLRSSISSPHTASGNLKDIEPVEREGSLHVKFTVLDGKRSTDRSWKQVWGVLRGPILYFYKDRHSQSPSATSDGDAGQNVDVRCSLVDVADDYTKRKYVLRVANPTAEVLLQTDDAASMALWLRSLHKHAAVEKITDINSSTSKQQAVPQTPGPTTTPNSGQIVQRLSPLPSHKGIRKLTSFRNRSPTGQSPVNKTRKPSQTVEPLASPKSKTWKGRVAKQLRRMHGQAGSPSSPTAQLPPEGATFKVPLELCPMSSFSEFIPLIVEMCTSIVEARGLEVIGIYRVPGNTAAISQLTESVNKGFENINLQDPRWSDVNVISSLLKSFFRQLPDSLLTADLYPMFIDADKIEDPQRRMSTIRKLLRDLPEYHFETLKHLMCHLKKVVEHSEINKMEAKNLAIVFGPTLVRASGSRDNMVTMVTDMSHQCRIVESLLNNVDWFFCEEDLDDLSRLSVNLSLPADGSENETSNTNHNLLLNNIQKVEGMREMVSAKDIVSSIISAANRKIQRRRKGPEEHEGDDHEDDKSKIKQDAETLVRQSMALNERQCSVSEIVLMHEIKSQPNNTNERNDCGQTTPATTTTTTTNNVTNSPKYSNNSQQQQQQYPTVSSSSIDSPRLSSSDNCCTGSLDTVSTLSNLSSDTKQSGNDEVAIRTYAGLSATTQERIRRFEQETKAMLQRDQHRQKREAEKRDEERKRIEMEWQNAKREMENDDIYDGICIDNNNIDNSSSYLTDRMSNLSDRIFERNCGNDSGNDRHRSKSTTRLTPMSIALQQQQQSSSSTSSATATQKAHATSQLSCIIGDKINNGVIKKFKIDKEPSMESLAPTRYGSLDSLHEVHTSPSPSHQTRGIPGDISDDGSDLLTSLTSTFDRKWKSLVNPSSILLNNTNVFNEKKDNNDDTDSKKTICTAEVFRDPSLHRSVGEMSHQNRKRNDSLDKENQSPITKCTDKLISKLNTTPDNDLMSRHNNIIEINTTATDSSDGGSILDATEKDENSKIPEKHINNNQDDHTINKPSISNDKKQTTNNNNNNDRKIPDISYTNKLKKFESLSKATNETRSRLKRSESLNKRTEINSSKLKRSESLNKHSDRLVVSPTNSKLKRSESLSKTEKTECNISKRRQTVRKDNSTKLKRKNGMPERSIKRRHTVGGTKDFDKVHWLDNKLQSDNHIVIKNDDDNNIIIKPKKSQLRTSSPDLSSNRVNVNSDASFLIEVSFRGPSNVVFNVTNTRPQSLPDANLASKNFKVPLESHV